MKFIDVYLVLTANLRAAPDICCLGFLNSLHCCSSQKLPCLYHVYLNTIPANQDSFTLALQNIFFLNSHCEYQPYTTQCTGSPWKPRGISGTPNMEQAFIPFWIRYLQSLQLNERGCYERSDHQPSINGSERLCCLLLTWSSPISLIQISSKSTQF